ncbi:unnamed protein product, partial [Coregonus sp. 'balchen']
YDLAMSDPADSDQLHNAVCLQGATIRNRGGKGLRGGGGEKDVWADQPLAPSAQYNFPINLYSAANVSAAQQLAQIASLEELVPVSVKTLSSIEESHVYRMLQDDQERPHEPLKPLITRSVRAPVTKLPLLAGSLQTRPLCDMSGNGIRHSGKFCHPRCFVCSDCNVHLKQRGYFFVEGQLYCGTHACARTIPP